MNAPRVSVVIPVYNGEALIANAIRSIQAQTYTNWDLTIGNNWSKDRTVEIAEQFAAEDPRIRVVTYPSFVSVVESHNNAFTLISDEAKYCVVLGADDLLFPRCLEEKVRLAESQPTVGLVGSHVLSGEDVAIKASNFPESFIPGREVGRHRFLNDVSLFGGPSTGFLRASIVRERTPFYNPINYYGDLEAYLELLQRYDFGFVYQVLTYTSKGVGSRTTSYLDRVDAPAAMRMHEIERFGAHFLEPEELERRRREITHAYYRFLGSNVWELRKGEFWDYHLKHVKKMGHPPRYTLIAWYALLRFVDIVGNPLWAAQALTRRLRGRFSANKEATAESHGPAPTVQATSPSRSPSSRTRMASATSAEESATS